MFFRKKLFSQNEFTIEFSKKLCKKIDGLKIVSTDELEVKCDFNGNERQYFLDNAYSEYIREPKLIKEIMGKYLNSAHEMCLPSEVINIERIFPIVKDRRFVNSLEKLNPDFQEKHIYEFYNDELVIFYAEDKEHSIQYISRKDLEEIYFPLEGLKEKAIDNLKNHIEIERHGEDGFYMITAGGNYESSLILFNIWHMENFPVKGDFVIGIPARDILYITGNKDSKNLHQLYDYVEKMNETGDHLVSDKIFEFKDGKFEILK